MYADMQAQQAAAAGAGTGGAAGGGQSAEQPADDNVVDAEVKEVKKGKRARALAASSAEHRLSARAETLEKPGFPLLWFIPVAIRLTT